MQDRAEWAGLGALILTRSAVTGRSALASAHITLDLRSRVQGLVRNLCEKRRGQWVPGEPVRGIKLLTTER